MISYAKAKSLLKPGDEVYLHYRGEVVTTKVQKVLKDALRTEADLLFFDEHGVFWFLTEKVAKEKLNENHVR